MGELQLLHYGADGKLKSGFKQERKNFGNGVEVKKFTKATAAGAWKEPKKIA